MIRLIVLLAIAAGAYFYFTHDDHHSFASDTRAEHASAAASSSDDVLERAFREQRSNLPVQASGTVDKILGDDTQGSRHQRFIVRLPSGHTILIAHNIDLAPRVSPISAGDAIEFKGEYEWNNKGGVVHWTHRDPGGRHQAGWIKCNGRTFQ